MSQRAENNYRLELYDELDDIITAMRNLAQVEMVRLEKAHRHQQTLFDSSQQALSHFLFHFDSTIKPQDSSGPNVLLALGSERGFCGGFNEQVAHRFRELDLSDTDIILVIGSRLASKLSDHHGIMALSAAVGIDESLPVMQSITDKLLQHGLPHRIRLLYHDRSAVQLTQLLPVEYSSQNSNSLDINLPPETLLPQLQWQHLQQALMLYLTKSLHTENRWRLQQMEGARDHLEELSLTLRKRINAQRQQQIVEEIEVILSDQTFD